MSSALRTLHLDLGPSWRGGQQQTLLLLQGLKRRGHCVELVARRSSPLALRAAAEAVPVVPVSAGWARAATIRLLHRLPERQSYDLIHAHDAHGHTACWLAVPAAGPGETRPARIAARRVAFPLRGNRLSRSKYQSGTDCIIAVSEFVKQHLLAAGLTPEKVDVVYDGIEIPPVPTVAEREQARRRWGYEANQVVLGCVGYLDPQKRQEILIRALPELLHHSPLCCLLLVGDGPERRRLERLARELGVESAVCLAGFVDDLASAYRALDLFLFPSLTDGLGSSLLSAMAYGLPVVAIRSGASPEVVETGRSGVLLDHPDPTQLAQTVGRLLGQPEQMSRMGQAAREQVQARFSSEQMVEGTLRVYEKVLARDTASVPGGGR